MKEIMALTAVYILEILINFLYFNKVFAIKGKLSVTLLKGLVCFLTAAAAYYFINISIVTLMSYFAACVFFAVWAFKCKILSVILHSALLTVLMALFDLSAIYGMAAIMKTSTSIYTENFSIYIIDSVLSKSALLIVCLILARFSHKEVKKKFSADSFLLILFPVSVIAMLAIVRKMDVSLGTVDNEYSTLISVVSFVLLFSVIAIYIIYENNLSKERSLFELKSKLQKNELDKAYFGLLKRQNDELRIFSHDAKNHLSMIKSLSNNEKVDKYIQNILDDIEKYSTVGRTKNEILDLILNKYTTLCTMNKIKFSTEIQNSNLNFFDDSDLSGLLNNLLDNAFEAAKISTERKIDLSIKRINGIDILVVINSCNTPPKGKDRNLITKKENKMLHGFGTKSIQKIIDKYNGEYEWFYDDNKRLFQTTLIFSYNEEQEA